MTGDAWFILGWTGTVLGAGALTGYFSHRRKKAQERYLEVARELLRDANGTQVQDQREYLYTRAMINLRTAGYILKRDWPEDIQELADKFFGRAHETDRKG